MIRLSKTIAALAVLFCGVLTMSGRAQEPDEISPRSRVRPPARQLPEGRSSAPDSGPVNHGRKGLSEETLRSLREIPAGHEPEVLGDLEDQTMPPPPRPGGQPGPERNPFSDSTAAEQGRPVRHASTFPQMPEYIVGPPDLLIVEVLEALPGRPISGERLIRPDGRISLGFYGEVPVAGKTIAEVKERIVLHLRKYVGDEILGLVELDPRTGEYKRDPQNPEQAVFKDPRETDRVFVDVTAYNSQKVYVLGDVVVPGRLPYTGGDTVLDMIQYAGGLMPSADESQIRLIRSYPKGSPARALPVDYKQITMGTDSSTNYAMLPNDRLVIPRLKVVEEAMARDRDAAAAAVRPSRTLSPVDPGARRSGYFDRRSPIPDPHPSADLEKRIEELEEKLDRLIEAVEKKEPKPDAVPERPRGMADGDGDPDSGACAVARADGAVRRKHDGNTTRAGDGGPVAA